jgi:PAS domain S-box-containing protein
MGDSRSPAYPIRSFPAGEDRGLLHYHGSPFRKGWARSVLLGLLVSLLTVGLWRIELFQQFELRTVDARFRLAGTRPAASPLAVVFIGDDSIEEFGRWPWSWDHHALLIDVLQRAGARSVLFDIFFAEAPDRSQEEFLGAMAARAGNVHFCSFFNGFAPSPGGSGPPLLEGLGLTTPVGGLLGSASGVGHCNALPDSDGNTRRVPLLVRHEGGVFPAAPLQVAGDYLGFSLDDLDLGDRGAISVTAADGTLRSFPVDGNGQTTVNFIGGLEAFPSYSFRQVLQADRYPDISPVDLEAFRDKIVLVGVTFTGNTDLRPTPFSSVYPMMGIQATLIDNILTGEFVRTPSRGVTILVWLLLGCVTGGLAFAFRPLVSMIITFLTGSAFLVATLQAFTVWRVQFELIGPLTAILLTYLAVTTLGYVETRKQKMAYLERMKYLGHLVESAVEAIISFDPSRKVVSWNHGAQEIFGYAEGDVLGREWSFLSIPEEKASLETILAQTLEGEGVEYQELNLLKADGTSIPVAASFSQIRDSRGGTVGMSLIAQDLSEKKKMIEMLVQSEKLAEIGRMGSGIVHEIKNPLTSIMMMSSILTADEQLPPKAIKYADIIEKESQRILRLSKNILSFARPQKPEMKAADLNGILDETLELVEYELKKAKVEVNRDFQGDLPPVRGDQEKLKQVFLNIITNAGHAMEGGGGLRVSTVGPAAAAALLEERRPEWHRCEVGEIEQGKLAAAQIEDGGPGMSAEVVEKIFEPFFSTKAEGKGTGLGLYISRNIVMEHHGRIAVESREGEGTVFTIFLPLEK